MKGRMKKMTEKQIQQAVFAALEPRIGSTEIGVAVQDGVVTLCGTIDTHRQRDFAEQAARQVYGVRAVVNDLRVVPTVTGRLSDMQIAGGGGVRRRSRRAGDTRVVGVGAVLPGGCGETSGLARAWPGAPGAAPARGVAPRDRGGGWLGHDDDGADLIVVGSHGLRGVQRFRVLACGWGSVSEKVLRHAHCSMLVVKQAIREWATREAGG